jgi:hypothetical protein
MGKSESRSEEGRELENVWIAIYLPVSTGRVISFDWKEPNLLDLRILRHRQRDVHS